MDQNPVNKTFLRREKGRLPYSVFKPSNNLQPFLKSIYEGRPPVVFFQYPPYVGIERTSERLRVYKRDEVENLFMSFRINDSTYIFNAIVNSCKTAGMTMLEAGENHFNIQFNGITEIGDIKEMNRF